MAALTEHEALVGLRHRPWRDGKEKVFCYATLTAPCVMHIWNGTHPVEQNTTHRDASAGTPVLVTMASRFGDVGIRDDRLQPPSEGYYARVFPEQLTDWRTAHEPNP